MSLKDTLKEKGKSFTLELWLEFNYDSFIEMVRGALEDVTPEDIKGFVSNKLPLPIPADAFTNMKGFEGFLEGLEPMRIVEWLSDARPDLVAALDKIPEAPEYIVNLKQYIVDTVKHGEQAGKQKKVTCGDCKNIFYATEEEAEALTKGDMPCPFCAQAERKEPAEQPGPDDVPGSEDGTADEEGEPQGV